MTDASVKSQNVSRFFGERLTTVRLAHGVATGRPGLTKAEFAKDLGISGTRPGDRYTFYEKGEREPPLWILAAIRKTTGFSLDCLIAGISPGKPIEDARSKTPPAAVRLSVIRRYLEGIRAGMSLAAEMDIDPSMWQKLESGEIAIPSSLLVEIGAKFDISFDYLLAGRMSGLRQELKDWIASKELPQSRRRGSMEDYTDTPQEPRNKRPPTDDSSGTSSVPRQPIRRQHLPE